MTDTRGGLVTGPDRPLEPAASDVLPGALGPFAWVVGAVRIVHPFPTLVVTIGSTALLLVLHGPGLGFLARAGGVVLLSQVAVGSLNDYLDRKEDAIKQPGKPIPRGLIPARAALAQGLAALLGLVGLAATLGPASLAVVGVGTFAALAYDLGLKRTPLSPLAYIVAFLSLLTWIWLVTGHALTVLAPVYLPAALLIVAAHLANALPDIETDGALHQRGLAVLLGPPRSLDAATGIPCLLGLVLACASALNADRLACIAGCVACALAGGTWLLSRRSLHSRGTRIWVFRAAAVATALTALGGVELLNSMA